MAHATRPALLVGETTDYYRGIAMRRTGGDANDAAVRDSGAGAEVSPHHIRRLSLVMDPYDSSRQPTRLPLESSLQGGARDSAAASLCGQSPLQQPELISTELRKECVCPSQVVTLVSDPSSSPPAVTVSALAE